MGKAFKKKTYILNKYQQFCLIIIFLFGSTSFLKSQNYAKNDLQIAMLKTIPEHVTWPNEADFIDFRIALITENQNFIKNFNTLVSQKKIKGKPISVSIYNTVTPELLKANMIFISSEKEDLLLNVFDIIEGNPILLVSDEFNDKRFVMVNLFIDDKNKMSFEINRANIINQKLEIGDEILLIGGSLIDVAELYRQSQVSLRSLEKQLVKNQTVYDSLITKIETTNETIKGQANFIDKQRNKMYDVKHKLDKVQKEFNEQKQLIDSQQRVLKKQRVSLTEQKKELNTTIKNLKQQDKNIKEGVVYLKKVELKLDSLNNEIANNQTVLNKQTTIISRQRQLMLFFSIAIFLFIILTTVIIYTLRSIKSKNKKLKAQKESIEDMNHELHASNQELNEKNEELRITLEQLTETQNQLVQSEKMASLGVLTAGIAHELNNPMNFVYSGVNSITRDLEDILPILNEIKQISPEIENSSELIKCIYELAQKNDFNEAVDAIIQTVSDIKIGAVRATEIIKGLRNFSRPEKDEWHKINIHNSIGDVLILLKNKYKDKVNIVTEFDPELPEIVGNGGKLNQAFMNIINNAIDAIPEKGNVNIRTEKNINYIRVFIRDDGEGISKENLSKIFDPFFTTKDVGNGIGLGLSITFSIIQEHRGNIEVNTEYKNGTEFIITLPIAPK